MSTTKRVLCDGCKKQFLRLATHLFHSPVCASHYDPQEMVNLHHHTNTLRTAHRTRRSQIPLAREFRVVDGHQDAVDGRHGHLDVVDDGTVPPFEAHFPNEDDAFVDSGSECEGGEGEDDEKDEHCDDADHSVYDLYMELFDLRANPHDLERFSCEEKVQIELLQLVRDLKAPLKAFNLILNWAAKSNESGHIFHVGRQPTHKKVMKNLYDRYNMHTLIPKEKQLYLPYSQRVVKVVYFDASAVFASLLSCPTINRDESFLFHDARDPFVAPDEDNPNIGDINTGHCYVETYKALVKRKDVDIILPSVLAMDKTHCDMAGRLQMEPITISHGLLKHDVRRLPIAMRILGYINHTTPAHTISQSECDPNFNCPSHLPKGTLLAKDPLPRQRNASWASCLLNETHMQIQFILEESGFLRLQEKGFLWNLHYGGKDHRVVLHPYVPFIIGDTEGHDRLCGHYTARFAGVQQLCRTCECPTLLTGYSKAKYPHRLPKRIDKLVLGGNMEALKSRSQHYLASGFSGVRFGAHNKRGIFGACPGEMLHLISLGWFKYCLEAFAAQVGPNSFALKQYDGLCAELGRRLSRQSDRDIPRTNFPKGFSSGTNLMGHEMAGCLLVKLFAMHTSYFREIFGIGKKKSKAVAPKEQKFRNTNHLDDWILAVSSLLMWHQWMKQPIISKKQVKRSHAGVQWLMRCVAYVAPRTGGMTNNTIKRHLVLHIREDILDHGVPDVVNSAYAESAHITLAKVTSRNTQKRAISFVPQAAHRYIENLVVSLASADLKNDSEKHGWKDDLPPKVPANTTSGGARVSGRSYELTWSIIDDEECCSFKWSRKLKLDTVAVNPPRAVSKFLSKYILPFMPGGKVLGFTSFVDVNGEKYRAHPCYDGRPWNDYAMVKWELDRNKSKLLPAFIHTFVDLRGLKRGGSIDIPCSGQTRLGPGLYALIYSYDYVEKTEYEVADILVGRYVLNFQSDRQTHPTMYLVDIDTIESPTVGIQDVQVDDGLKVSLREQHHIFLLLRKAMWSKEWDSVINSCVGKGDKDLKDKVEEEYETEIKENDITVGVKRKSLEELTKAHAAAIASRKKKRGGEDQLAKGSSTEVAVASATTRKSTTANNTGTTAVLGKKKQRTK